MYLLKSFLAIVIISTLLFDFAPQGSGETVGKAKAAGEVALTVYQQDLALVRDQRTIRLSRGLNEVVFEEVPAGIEPTSVFLKIEAPHADLQILEQDYRFNVMESSTLLKEYVGREIEIHQSIEGSIEEKISRAVLLSTNDENVYKIGDKIHLGHPGRPVLPRAPEKFLLKNRLSWLVKSGKGGEFPGIATYLTRGISWRADYVITVDTGRDRSDIMAWATIDNRSGTDFKEAELSLVAGTLNLEEEVERDKFKLGVSEYARKPEQAPVQEERFFEYHLYSVDRPMTIGDNQLKQLVLFSARDVSAKKLYIFDAQPYFVWYAIREPMEAQVETWFELKNDKKDGLGLPLPAGKARFYKNVEGGGSLFIGEDRMEHTPVEESFRLFVGRSFDITGERLQTDYKQLSKLSSKAFEFSYRITLRNHLKEGVSVTVVEHLEGDWEVMASSMKYNKKDYNTIEFDVPIKAEGEAVVTYTARVRGR